MVQVQNNYYRCEDHVNLCSQLSPAVYRIRRTNETREVSTHLAHITPFHPLEKPPALQFDKLSNFVSGKEIALPALDHQDQILLLIVFFIVDRVVSHRCGPCRKRARNFKYRLHLQDYGPESDIEYQADEVPQCHELIDAYRTANRLNNRACHIEAVW